jgi:hypothetical protein
VSLRNAFGIYHVLERLLKESDRPLTCVELFDFPEVQKLINEKGQAGVNKVSDYLGHMFRRELLKRVPGNVGSARFAYTWKNPNVGSPTARTLSPRLTVVDHSKQPQGNDASRNSNGAPRAVVDRQNLRILESAERIILETPQLRITIELTK